MKQKGIVLLITLFFISAISVLILKNLDDSEKFIDESSYDTRLTQLKITKENVEVEIKNFINKNQDNIKENFVEPLTLPFQFGNVNLIIDVSYLGETSCNINEIKSVVDILKKCGENIAYNILDKHIFVENLNKLNNDNNISTKEQLDYFIDEYKMSINDEQIDSIKNDFSFIPKDINATYIKCDYNVFIEEKLGGNGSFILKVGDTDTLTSSFVLE